MKYLKFFDEIEKIIVHDELCKFLGVNEDGVLEFSYADIVKSAGHSCGTVSGAYLISLEGLKELYSNEELPERGMIKVELKKTEEEENTGVVGFVLSNITGATTNYGFGGSPTGKFNRRGTLIYGSNIKQDVVLTNIKTGEKVGIDYKPQRIVKPMEILMSAIKENATKEDIESFPKRFQDMVKHIFDNKEKVIDIVKFN